MAWQNEASIYNSKLDFDLKWLTFVSTWESKDTLELWFGMESDNLSKWKVRKCMLDSIPDYTETL